jgi:hypothetical protein
MHIADNPTAWIRHWRLLEFFVTDENRDLDGEAPPEGQVFSVRC